MSSNVKPKLRPRGKQVPQDSPPKRFKPGRGSTPEKTKDRLKESKIVVLCGPTRKDLKNGKSVWIVVAVNVENPSDWFVMQDFYVNSSLKDLKSGVMYIVTGLPMVTNTKWGNQISLQSGFQPNFKRTGESAVAIFEDNVKIIEDTKVCEYWINPPS